MFHNAVERVIFFSAVPDRVYAAGADLAVEGEPQWLWAWSHYKLISVVQSVATVAATSLSHVPCLPMGLLSPLMNCFGRDTMFKLVGCVCSYWDCMIARYFIAGRDA